MTGRGYTVPAVLVGAGINGLGVLRSLARAGVPVVLLGTKPDQPAMLSRYGRKVVYRGDDSHAMVKTLEAVADDAQAERAVLIATMEETVAVVMRHYDRLAARFHLTMPRPDRLAPLMHKDGVRAVAQSAGVRIPETLRIQTPEQISMIDALRLPIVIKPARRDRAYARAFSKAYRFDRHADARNLLVRVLPVLPDVVVQEWIEGTDSDLYFCLQYLPADDRAPTSFVGRKIRSWPPRVGGTASCTAAPEASALIETTTAFFRHAGVSGLAGLEYKRDRASGDYIVVEPTVGRTDFQEEVATLNGVNLPLAAYCDVLGLARPEIRPARRARIWRERIGDIQAAQQTPAHETIAPTRAVTIDALGRIHDPKPALMSLSRRAGARLGRALGRRNLESTSR